VLVLVVVLAVSCVIAALLLLPLSVRSEREHAVAPARTSALATTACSARLETGKSIYLSSTWFVTSYAWLAADLGVSEAHHSLSVRAAR
jgi:hypothetical protein